MQFDPLAPEFRSDPYPYYKVLRQQAPIYYWEPWQIFFLTDHQDNTVLLRDNRLIRGEIDPEMAPPSQQDLVRMQADWLLLKDPPDHTRLRGLVFKAFTPKMVTELRSMIQQVTNSLIDKFQPEGHFDLIADLAYPLPVTVIAEMLGIPEKDQDQFHDWSKALAQSLDMTEDPAVYDRASEAAVIFTDYLADLADERRKYPKNDLLSALVAVEEAGERLTTNELYATSALLFVAGHETTINLIGNGMLALLRHPEQLALLKQDSTLIKTAVEEFLRYDSPVQLTTRFIAKDFTYKGHHFHKWAQVGFLLGAANHDPKQFSHPDKLDINRQKNPHLSFGGGIHYCLGAPLARLEGEIAFITLLKRLPDLQLLIEKPEVADNFVLRGLKSLPLTF